MAVGPAPDGLHHQAPAEVLAAVLQPHAIAVGGVSINEQPVPRACGANDWAVVDVAAGHRDFAGYLLLNQLKVCGLHQPGGDAVTGEGLQLSVGVGGVAVVLHLRMLLAVAICARNCDALERLQEHRATGRKAGAITLRDLRRIALLEAGHTHQGVGVAATGGPLRGRAASATGGLWFGRCGGSAPERRFCLAAPPPPRLASPARVHEEQQRRRHLIQLLLLQAAAEGGKTVAAEPVRASVVGE